MKKIYALLVALVFLASCTKESAYEEPSDQWNGYYKYLKCGTKTQNLRDKQNNIVGVVRSGFDNDAHFFVEYDCSSSGKQLSKTNMFAGNKSCMPISHPEDPKENHFPNSQNHNSGNQVFRHNVPCNNLPPADEPGFVYSAHCKFKDSNGNEHDAWAQCGKKFHDNDCGSYDDDYNLPDNQFPTIYGMTYASDTLKVYLIYVTTDKAPELILQEYVGNTAGSYDGAAYNPESGLLYFTKDGTQLYFNDLEDDALSVSAGTLDGVATSATFYNDLYYYVDANTNTIHTVSFNTDNTIATESVVSTIPNSVTVNDIAMDPSGSNLYIVGEVNSGGTELITWQTSSNTYYTMALTVADDAQIAYGSDNNLYVVVPEEDGSVGYIIDTNTGVLTEISSGGIGEVEDPLADITKGPTL